MIDFLRKILWGGEETKRRSSSASVYWKPFDLIGFLMDVF